MEIATSLVFLLLWGRLDLVFSQQLPPCIDVMTTVDVHICQRNFTLLANATPYALWSEQGPSRNMYGLTRKFFALAGSMDNFVIWQDKALQIWCTWVTGQQAGVTMSISTATNFNLIQVANNGDIIIYMIANATNAGDGVTPLNVQLVKADVSSGLEVNRSTVPTASNSLNIYDWLPSLHSGDMVWNVALGQVGSVFSREMVKSSDGLNHHGAISVVFDANTLVLKRYNGQTSGHSFANNLILNSAGAWIGMDLGDNYPRGINGFTFSAVGMRTLVQYAFKTLHGTAPNYCLQYNVKGCNLPQYPVYTNISTPNRTFYQWSNDNQCYTELAHKGLIELSDSYMLIFAGENPPLNNSQTGANLNMPRNLGMLRKGKANFPSSASVSVGEDSVGGLYSFNGAWQAQSNTGVVWLTSSTDLNDNVSRPKTARVGVNMNLITWESWTSRNFVSSRMMLLDDEGGIIWGPIDVTNPIQLPQGDDLFVSGNKAYGYVGHGSSLIQYEISLAAPVMTCAKESTEWGVFPDTNLDHLATIGCPPDSYNGTATRYCTATGTWLSVNSSGCIPLIPPCQSPGPAPGGWPQTQPNSTATKPCPDGQIGSDTLFCNSEGIWESEVNTCVYPPNCSDGIQNQGETGIDCGCATCVPACPPCLVCEGIVCGLHGSCIEPNPVCVCTDDWSGTNCEIPPPSPCQGVNCGSFGACSESSGLCICLGGWSGPSCGTPPPPTCFDGIQNSDETGIDCGGALASCKLCPYYTWQVGEWTNCTLTCNAGTQTRSVLCIEQTSGSAADPNNCSLASEMPSSFQLCNVDPCPIYTWVTGNWDDCSAPCNSGTQTRNVDCYSSAGNVTVPIGCEMDLKPDSKQTCNTDACAAPHWEQGPWSNCSNACGGGTQTRTVQCFNATKQPSSECTEVAPPSSRSCNLVTCETYHWYACPTFYPCSAQCNAGRALIGMTRRDVFCIRDSDSMAVDAVLCADNDKPSNLDTTCNPQPCIGFNWYADEWGPCLPRGDGVWERQRIFQCHDVNGAPVPEEDCKSFAGPMPIAILPCTLGTCANPNGCPIVEIASAFNQCNVVMIQSCHLSAQCGAAIQTLDKAFETMGLSSNTAAGCVTDYVSGLAPQNQPAEAVVEYVKQQYHEGNRLCDTGLSGSPLIFPLQPVLGLIVFSVFVV